MRVLNFLVVLAVGVASAGAFEAANPQQKIDSRLRSQLETHETVDILVSFKEGVSDVLARLQARSNMYASRAERSTAVYDALRSRAEASQSRVRAWLAKRPVNSASVTVTTLWMTNQLSVRGPGVDSALIHQIAAQHDVEHVYWDEPVYLDAPSSEGMPMAKGEAQPMPLEVQWGVDRIGAPGVWSMFGGSNGSGIIVANIDTGVRSTHEILRASYADDGRSWFDPYERSQRPSDIRGHGSHVMGTIVGANGYGVAPGARWIACKGLQDDGSGASSQLIMCGEWLICPTDPNGNNADCTRTPHVVANSWGGAGGRTLYDNMIAGWHTAGIVPVFSGGNNGPGCGTAGGPGDRDVLGIGSTTDTDALSSFSGVGPSLFGTMKPELSAPGSLITSADPASDSSYSVKSGTSMACPHVAGAVALLLSRRPGLSYAEVKALLQDNAERQLQTTGVACSGVGDMEFPNHQFGHGRLDVARAYRALLEM